jgi:CBS domain containing-hemolysin-like protein
MNDISGPRSPRIDGADDEPSQSSLQQQVRGWLRAVFGGRGEGGPRDSIDDMVDDRTTEAGAAMSDEERTLLVNILKLRRRSAADLMVPRADIFSIDIDTPIEEAARRMADEAHSRVPVYRETLDDVVGMVHVKDVLSSLTHGNRRQLSDLVREVLIVAPGVPVLALLLQMRQTRHHMAMVVDEFGGIDGLVTIEDLLEEIVGEIEDEFDEDDEPRLIARPDGTYLADARLPVERFEMAVGAVLTEDERYEHDTLGGLAFSLAGRVPARGEVLRHGSGMEFEIVDADPRRIRRLRIRNVPPVPRAESDARGANGK